MPGDVAMIFPGRLVLKILIPLLLLGVAIGTANAIVAIKNSPTATASRRSDNTYIRKLTSAFPAMKNTFTVADVRIQKQHWAVVTIKNTQNSDVLTALFYDPEYSEDAMQLVVAPSSRTSLDTYMTPANVIVTGGDSHAAK